MHESDVAVARRSSPRFLWTVWSFTALLLLALSGLVVLHLTAAGARSTSPLATTLQGTDLGGSPAPAFSLPDQNGATISLDQYRGHPVVLTFFDSVCPHSDCSLMAQYLNWTSQDMGAKESAQVEWIALSLNPWHDTRASAQAFLKSRQVTMPLHYVLGTLPQLAPLWSGYHMQSIVQPNGIVIHTTGVYVIDQQSRERIFLDEGFDPHVLSGDLHLLLTNPAVMTAPVESRQASQIAGYFSQTQTNPGGTITLSGTPGQYGTYDFDVLVWDARSLPVQGTAVVELSMTDMNMGVLRIPLTALGDGMVGRYHAQGVLSMAGHWKAVVTVAPHGSGPAVQATFLFTSKS